jgi:hypothetical protein
VAVILAVLLVALCYAGAALAAMTQTAMGFGS